MKILPILVCLGLFLALPTPSSASTHVLFFPDPCNTETSHTFANMAHILVNTNNYICTALTYTNHKAFSWAGCNTLVYGLESEEVFYQKLHEAQKLFDNQSLFALRAFKEIYEIQIEAFYDAPFIYELKKLAFDVIVCDTSNLLCNMISTKLGISKIVYYASTIRNLYWVDHFDIPLSHNIMGNSLSLGSMSLIDRAKNHLNYYIISLIVKYQKRLVKQILLAKGESFVNTINHESVALFTTQDVYGLTDALYLPPNMEFLGCVSCLYPSLFPTSLHEFQNNLTSFVRKYKRVVLAKLDRVSTQKEAQMIIETFETLKDTGFIIQGDLFKVLPDNMIKADQISTSKLLAKERIAAFVHNGDYTSILEGIYHKKAMVVINHSFDRRANAALVREKNFGVVIEKEEFTKAKLQKALIEVINKQLRYKENMKKYSELVAKFNSQEEVEKWFNYYVENGSEQLVVKSYYNLSPFEYYNMDIWLLVGLVPSFGILYCCRLISNFGMKWKKKTV